MEGFGARFLASLLILLANAFFAASEVALVSSRVSRLRELAAGGNVGAQAAVNLLANSERLLSVVQVGVTLASLALGVTAEKPLEYWLIRSLTPLGVYLPSSVVTGASILFSYLIMTYFHVVIGEVVPKNIAIEKSERLAVVVSPVLLVFYRIVEPFVLVLERSATAVSKALGLRGQKAGGHSVEELKFILSSSLREGVLEGFSGTSIQRLMDLQDYLTREIMVPRNQIVSVPVTATLDQLLSLANEHQYSRLPVYEGGPEHLIGYIHTKDLLRVWQERRLATEKRRSVRPFDLRWLLRTLPVVPESKPVLQLLDEFRQSHAHMAMVVDEFGTTVGIVSLEDVIEQVFGEIEDEHDVRRPSVTQGSSVLEVEGTIPIRDLELQYGILLPTEGGYETLAGFLLYKLGYIPKPGDAVEQDGRRYVVKEMDRNRIARVLVERTPAAKASAPASGDSLAGGPAAGV
ncbi:MAG: hemolysin family protein [Bryobacteraceae bacterium]|nr:hemolysin family protein [Bryobacteraceae bacterium]MDW8378039.1 hemolysin family protein [Bryobacterales bacterium]